MTCTPRAIKGNLLDGSEELRVLALSYPRKCYHYFMFVCPQCASSYPHGSPCPRDGAIPLANNGDGLLGAAVGSYRIAAKIGAGGMGTVYRAVHPDIGSVVAIKVLSHASAADADTVNRFFEEARSVNVIRHQNIVNILDLARLPDGRPFIVMEFIDGEPLKGVVRRGPMDITETCRIIIAVLDALAAAHERGVLHRDLKPDNIMLSHNGRVTLVDFGVAKIAANVSHAPRTESGLILGTPQYMSPEQAQGRAVDAATDIYAIGIVLYEMLTGRRPFEGDSLFEILRAQISDAPRPPSQLVPMPAELESIIMVALAKDARQRFGSARAMQHALRQIATTVSMSTPTPRAAWDANIAQQTNPSQIAAASIATKNERSGQRGAHASSFSMIAQADAPRTRAADAPKPAGKRSKVGVAIGATVAIAAAAAIPLWRSQQNSAPATASPLLSQGGAVHDVAPVDFRGTSIADVPACKQLLPILNAVLTCSGIDHFMRERTRTVFLDTIKQHPDGAWCEPSIAIEHKILIDGGCNIAGVNVPTATAGSSAPVEIRSIEELNRLSVSAPAELQKAMANFTRMDTKSPFTPANQVANVDAFLTYAQQQAKAVFPDAQLVGVRFAALSPQGTIAWASNISTVVVNFFSPAAHARPSDVNPADSWTPTSSISIQITGTGVLISRGPTPPTPSAMTEVPWPTCLPSQLWATAFANSPPSKEVTADFEYNASTQGQWTTMRGGEYVKFADKCGPS